MSIDFQSPESMNASIESLAKRMYYGEDHEVFWSARELLASIPSEHANTFRETFLKRLVNDPSLANLFLGGCFGFGETVPYAVNRLRQLDDASGEARLIMQVLAGIAEREPEQVDPAFTAIRPFLDSAAEQEALQCLTRIDFVKAMPHLRAALRIDHQLKNCVHILHARRRATNFETLLGDITRLMEGDEVTLKRRLTLALRIQDEPYNPFSEDERATILGHLR